MDANLKRMDSHDLSQGSIYEWIGEKPPTLQQAQRVGGGLVQLLTHVNGDQFLVDEEGLLKDRKMNVPASELLGYRIVGTSLLLRGDKRWLDEEDEDEE